MGAEGLVLDLPSGGFERRQAAEAVRASGLVDFLHRRAPGPFGLSAAAVALLEGLVESVDEGWAAARALRGMFLEELSPKGSLAVAELGPLHELFAAAFQVAVTADGFRERARALAPEPSVEGSMELAGLEDLLRAGPGWDLAARILRLAVAYLERKESIRSVEGLDPGRALTMALAAFFELLRRAVVLFGKSTELRALQRAVEERQVLVAGRRYRGLVLEARQEDPSGLLDVWPDQIVGNEEYLQAGLRLARDVAAYDFRLRRNPKKINPVLFGLGRPGCGKTVTAHAIGNYFLDYCRRRGVRARFRVVRRTDWASSYQNASAANLVRIFREEVYGFDGVCGVYWPDIDTAFASRSSDDLRMEEKQNLGAVFGIFDGTLLPRDGKWFLVCDANTMNMDEATVSRIAQNPFQVEGPTTVEDYVRLARDVLLADLREFLPKSEADWREIGESFRKYDLSGRNVDAVCRNIRSRIQDFEFPDEYFRADPEQRAEMVRRLSHPVSKEDFLAAIDAWTRFQREAEERAERERFQREVEELVRRLNASRAAAERAARLGLLEPGERPWPVE